MMVEMICAGFGGQGVLTTGLILAEAGMKLGMNVLWYPSYGSEMRGGTANCTIKFSDKEIASPCAKKIDILMAMNAPAIDKFESSLAPGRPAAGQQLARARARIPRRHQGRQGPHDRDRRGA